MTDNKKEKDNPSDYSWSDLGMDALKYAGQYGVGYLMKDMYDPEISKAGYQGKVEPRTMYRKRVRDTGGPRSKTAGAKARRYFTDTVFARDPGAQTDLVKNPEVLDTGFVDTYTADTLGEYLAPGQIGTVVYTEDETRRKQTEGGNEQAQVIATTETAEGDRDLDNKTYHMQDGKYYEILEPDLYDGNNTYDTGGFELETIAGTQDPNKQYTADGYEIIEENQRMRDGAPVEVTPEGYEILERGTQYDLGQSLGGINPNTGEALIFDADGRVLESAAEYYDVDSAVEAKLADQVAAREAQNARAGYDARQYGGAQAFGGIDPFTGIASNARGGHIKGYTMGGGVYSQKGGLYGKDEDEKTKGYNMGGGVMQLAGGRYLDGMTDGMADKVPSSIDGVQPAALSDGEFVIPADVVSHLGNGSSNAGAKVLDDMMANVRKERTGNPKQGKQINPRQVMAQGGIAQFANGGGVKRFNTGDMVQLDPVENTMMQNTSEDNNPTPTSNDTPSGKDSSTPSGQNVVEAGMGKQTGTESALSNYIAPYVMDMLGKGMGVGDSQYEGYDGYGAQYEDIIEDGEVVGQQLVEAGDISAGASDLQNQAFASAMGMDTSGAGLGSFGNITQEQLEGYMNPYLQGALDPQLREAKRQADIQRVENQARMTQAGSFGGSRSAIMDMANRRDLNQQQQDITAKGYNEAFQQARDQFGADRDFGLQALQQQADMGTTERQIYQDAIDADKAAFEEARDFDSNKVQFMQSLLQGLPLQAQDYTYAQASDAAKTSAAMADFNQFLQSDVGQFLSSKGTDFVDYLTDTAGDVFGGGEEEST